MPVAPRIEVTPEQGQVDGPIAVQLSGFPPGGELTLTASLDDGRGRVWSSRAVFRADETGALDLSRAAPLSGNYSGADVEGLLWSLEPTDGAPKASFEESNLAPLVIRWEARVDDRPIATATNTRHFVADAVRADPIDHDGLVGTLFRPKRGGPFPGVLILGGSAGGQVFSLQCAALLAAHGYAALSLAYFAAEGLPEQLVGIRLEYFCKAMTWLRAQDDVRNSGPAVIGRSRGGELALLLAATFPEIHAAVGYTPSDVVWAGIRAGNMVEASAWTWQDREVPYAFPRLTPEQKGAIFAKRPVALLQMFEQGVVEPAVRTAATIPVERIRGPVLVFSGDADEMWPASRMCDAVVERLAAHRHPHPFAHHRYPGSGHLLRAPCVPTSVLGSPQLALGGEAAGQALANRRSWAEVLRVLSEACRPAL